MGARGIAVTASLVACLAGAAAVSCLDPQHESAVTAMGPETSGGPGPTHRPGEPCLVCHGGSGPASSQFSVAGTVYQAQTNQTPLNGGTVKLTDANGSTFTATTNEAGNFYVEQGAWAPVYPMRVAVTFNGTEADMSTHVGRDGSCATCHYDPSGARTPGHVYLVLDPADFPGAAPAKDGGGP
jgi:hypothetical protein